MSEFRVTGVDIREPHVQALVYSVSAESGTEYVNPETLDVQHALGRFRIEERKLRIEPVAHFGTEEEARAAFDPVVQAWEMEAALHSTIPGTIRFRFESAEVIDLNPPPPGASADLPVRLSVRAIVALAGDVVAKRTFSSYPPPPQSFSTSTEVDAAFRRWERYRAGREPLLTMTYFVLTALLSPFPKGNKVAAAASHYAIDREILRKVSELSSKRGDESIARKFEAGQASLTDAEKLWLEKVVPRLIIRLGEHAAGVTLAQITNKECPLP